MSEHSHAVHMIAEHYEVPLTAAQAVYDEALAEFMEELQRAEQEYRALPACARPIIVPPEDQES